MIVRRISAKTNLNATIWLTDTNACVKMALQESTAKVSRAFCNIFEYRRFIKQVMKLFKIINKSRENILEK